MVQLSLKEARAQTYNPALRGKENNKLGKGEAAKVKKFMNEHNSKQHVMHTQADRAKTEQEEAAYKAAVADMPGQIESVKRRAVKDKFLLEAYVVWKVPKDPSKPGEWVHVDIKKMPHKLMRDVAWAKFREENPVDKQAIYASPYVPAFVAPLDPLAC